MMRRNMKSCGIVLIDFIHKIEMNTLCMWLDSQRQPNHVVVEVLNGPYFTSDRGSWH